MSSAPDDASDDSLGDGVPPRITAIPADPARSDDLTGQRIGDRYTLERLLGSGSIGRTFRAVRDADAMPVALKLIDARLAADKTFMRRLARDVDAAGKLEHLHVARIFEQGTDSAHGPFISRELIEGEDLLSALSRRAPTPRRICELLIQVLSALSEAQRHGVLHRNLKPQNVLVSHDSGGREIVKVCDFGNPQRARPGAEYLAPELAAGQAIDGQADVYAVGIILYELLAGAVPFRGANPDETLALQRSAPVEPPGEKRAGWPLPRELEAVCLKALEKDPLERHRSPREMSQALRAVISLLGMHADESLGSSVFAERGVVADTARSDRMTMPGEHMRSHTKFWLGAALVAAVCVAVWLNPAPEQTVDSTAPTRSLSAARRNGALALENGSSKLRAGDTKAAIFELRNARRALGDTPEVLRALGEALVIQGEREEGTRLLARYLELDPNARDRGFVQSLLRRAGEPE